MKKYIIGSLAICAIIFTLIMGAGAQARLHPTRIIEVPIPVEKLVLVPDTKWIAYEKEAPEIQYVVVPREVIKEVVKPMAVSPFQSLEELEELVAGYTPIVSENVFGLGSPSEIDCEDYVFAMIDTFLQSGYYVTSQILMEQR